MAIATQDFSFSFAPTGLYCLVGESGSGKTTLLNELSSLLRPDEGEVLFEGDSLYGDPKRSKRRKDAFSYVFQEGNLLEEKTVLENLLLSSRERTAIQKALERFHVLDKMDSPVARLSGGEKQRVAIARSFLRGTKVLILDEPTASLDKENGEKVFQAIQEASKSSLCIVSTHNRELAESYADVLLFLEDGRLKETKGEGASGNVASDKGEPSKGRIPLLFGWKSLWRRKAKAIATLAVSSLAMLFVIAGASFAFFDPVPSFQAALNAQDSWFLPLQKWEWNEETRNNDSFGNGTYFQSELQKAFGEAAFPYQLGSFEEPYTNLNIIPYFDGLEIHGTAIQEVKKGEVAISSFVQEMLQGDSLSITSSISGATLSFHVGQVVHVSYDPEELQSHRESSSYQRDHQNRFASYFTYAIVSKEDFSAFNHYEQPIFLPYANIYSSESYKDRYKDPIPFASYADAPLLAGRAPEKESEIVAPYTLLPDSFETEPSEYLGRTFRFLDIASLSARKEWLTHTNVYDFAQEVEVVGVVEGTTTYLFPSLMDKITNEDFHMQWKGAAYAKERALVSSVLSECAFQSFDPLFEPIYHYLGLKRGGIGVAIIVLEILFGLLAGFVGFSLGQDAIANKPKETALLLTLGFEAKDVASRYLFAESLFLLIAIAAGLLLSGAGLFFLNLGLQTATSPYALFHFNYLGLLLALIVGLLTTLLSSLGSFRRLNRLQIADIFRGKETISRKSGAE